jgi:hypothetical protein
MFNGNGLHKDTPWLWVLLYRILVLGAIVGTGAHQILAHSQPTVC